MPAYSHRSVAYIRYVLIINFFVERKLYPLIGALVALCFFTLIITCRYYCSWPARSGKQPIVQGCSKAVAREAVA
jgi:hypothetical protein